MSERNHVVKFETCAEFGCFFETQDQLLVGGDLGTVQSFRAADLSLFQGDRSPWDFVFHLEQRLVIFLG